MLIINWGFIRKFFYLVLIFIIMLCNTKNAFSRNINQNQNNFYSSFPGGMLVKNSTDGYFYIVTPVHFYGIYGSNNVYARSKQQYNKNERNINNPNRNRKQEYFYPLYFYE